MEHVIQENGFQRYQLEPEIIQALERLGYREPTEIQREVIPLVLRGRDVLAKSKTGTGKTAAFAVPICQGICWEENRPQALVLEPTRELAFQVRDELFAIGRMKRLKVPVLHGGFPMDKQILTLRQKSHIVTGTPGRVLDHCRRGTLDLSAIRYVVIDEADLMLDMGFLEDVKSILSYIKQESAGSDGKTKQEPAGADSTTKQEPAGADGKTKQEPAGTDTKSDEKVESISEKPETEKRTKRPVMLLFSATMEERIEALAEAFLWEPVQIRLQSDTETVDTIEQIGYYADEETKFQLFTDVLITENPENCMIFCGTREMVEVLYYKLRKEGIGAGMLHGMIDQKIRTKTIEEFRTGGFRYLIATDVAARGVDFEGITHVLNYDLPTNKEVYVHRIGRTGRNGAAGRAISFIREEELKMLRSIEQYTGVSLAIRQAPDEETVETAKEAFYASQRIRRPRRKKKQDVFGDQILKLTIGGGKKSKIRSGDIVGAISGIEGIDGKNDIGVIDIRDSITYVEILNGKGRLVLEELQKRTIKGKYRKIHQTR